jgi:hypothetical protein
LIFLKYCDCKDKTCLAFDFKNRRIRGEMTNFG